MMRTNYYFLYFVAWVDVMSLEQYIGNRIKLVYNDDVKVVIKEGKLLFVDDVFIVLKLVDNHNEIAIPISKVIRIILKHGDAI